MLKRKSKNTDSEIKDLTVEQVIKAWRVLSDKPVSYAKQLK